MKELCIKIYKRERKGAPPGSPSGMSENRDNLYHTVVKRVAKEYENVNIRYRNNLTFSLPPIVPGHGLLLYYIMISYTI